MMYLDKLKIITSINFVSNINKDKFQIITENQELKFYKYQQKIPYLLVIIIDCVKNELVIEFTSKILKDKSIELINKENIQECFNEINNLNICNLDINKIINNSIVVKCDVTKDVVCQDIKELREYISNNLSNYKKWIYKHYKGGIVLENVVATARYKKRLSIYTKREELTKANNAVFLNSLVDKEKVLSFYDNKIRFEQNINTKTQIRSYFNIDNNNLLAVLNTEKNPILMLIDEIIKPVGNIQTNYALTLRETYQLLFLKDCNNDLLEVEIRMRNLCSKNTSISRMMMPYKMLHLRLQANGISTVDIRKLVA